MTRQHLQHRGLAAIAASAALLIVVGLPTAAGADRPEPRTRVTVYDGGVDLEPRVAYQKAILTVSGNGQTYRYELAPGEPLSIGLFDPAGQLLADGSYSWELELMPDRRTAARLRAEAASNNGRAPQPWAAESGSFAIRNAAIADPALTEALAVRRLADAAAARPAAPGVDRRAADGDGAVGLRLGVEALVNDAAARATPQAAAGGVLLQADRAAGDDADAAAIARGRSLEAAATSRITPQSRGAFAPRPRSDGSNGRPRSQ